MKHFYHSISGLAAVGMLAASLLFNGTASAQEKHQNPKVYDAIEEDGWGDWNGVITGRVIDKYGKPLPNATVKVHSKDLQTQADRNGYFTLKGLQQGGHYSLIFTAKGREPAAARWIPIPRLQSANIGDFSLDVEKIWTNFWVISSTLSTNGVQTVVSNYYNVADSVTSIFSYAEWNTKFNASSMLQNYRALQNLEQTLTDEKTAESSESPDQSGTDSSGTNSTGVIPEKQPVINGGT